MAKSRQSSVQDKIADVTECSICTEILTNPKILPCVHTFCLRCLENYGMGKNPGNRMACPNCRNEFIIPYGGLCNLPNNFFIGKMVEMGKLAMRTVNEAICDVCPEGEEVAAKMFCVDCEQILCERCSKSHIRMMSSQTHQLAALGSKLNAQQLNFRSSYCSHHPKELIKMYCKNDKEAICLICCVESHESHERINIEKAAEGFKQQIKEDLEKVSNRLPECDGIFKKLQKYKDEFEEQISKTEANIRDTGTKLKELIDQQTETLVQNLKATLVQTFKAVVTTKEAVERFGVMIESFSRYTEELLSQGSPVDVCRAADQIHNRANELEKLPVHCSGDPFCPTTVDFQPSSLETFNESRANNLVGVVRVTKSEDCITNFDVKRAGDSIRVSRPMKGAAKTTYQKSAKGPVAIYETALDGKYIAIENTGRKDESLGGWSLSRNINGSCSANYKFAEALVLRPGQKIKVWAKGTKPFTGALGDIESDQNWGVGANIITKLLNPIREERATHIQ